MLELTGMMAITGVFIGSVLVALFVGEGLISLIIRSMHEGVRRADEAAARQSGQPLATASPLRGQRARLQRV
ncbi:MAG: hypothetical protein DMG61_15175 [Acidobacteria bacterium]|nr:MAG: hypothetical protein DMG61_15175 [Acidobacteriota bacterium]